LGLRSYEDGMELARASYQEALAQDSAYARAQEGLGRVALFYDGNYPAADRFFQQALALGPGDARILRAVGRLELTMGRIDTAIELYRQSLTLDPLGGHTGLGTALFMAGENKEAAELFATAVSLNPNSPARHYRLSRALLSQGKSDEALATIQAEPEDSYKLAGLALIQHARGETEAADGALRELIELYSKGGAFQIAETYAFRGNSDEAFVWLEKAHEVRDSGLISVLPDPLFVSLHNDPRWVRFLDKMGLPH
jgi:adenylate cyclase